MRQGLVKVSMVGLLFLVVLIGQLTSSACAQPVPGDISAKIHFSLLELLDRPLPLPPQDKGLVRIDEQSRVQVYIHAEPATQGLLDHIAALGGKVDGQGLGVIQAWVPVQAMESLAALPEVRYIRPPDYGHPNVGSVTTQGDAILGASAGRQQFGVNGTGVRVGVISTGLKGLEQSIASGDLPPTSFFCRSPSFVVTQRPSGCLAGETLILTTGGITGTPFPSGANMASDPEGTAMLEIVRDLAPGAELWFAEVSTSVDLATAASFLAAHVDIIVSDILFGYFPDGQNTVARGVAQVMANPAKRARAFIQAAGNYADTHYSGLYTDSGISDGLGGTFHLFAANSQTTGPSGPLAFNRFTVPPFETATVYLSWNDPAGAATNNYDVRIYDCTTQFIYDSGTIRFPEPLAVAQFTNFSLSPFPVCYAIRNVLNMAAPRILNVVIDGIAPAPTVCPPSPAQHMFNTLSMSLLTPADTPGDLIAVGAVPQCSPSQIEVFSSRGPTFDGRVKPDVVAVDGVSVTGAGGFPTPFFGTSAAAPHVAAIAALLIQCNPALTSRELRNALTQSAVDLGGPGFDFAFGFGRVDALNALANAGGCGGPIKAVLQTADYDDDGKTDIAVYRPSNGTWFIINSATSFVRAQQWGAAGDIPVLGDFDGDGKDDIAVYRPSTGFWFIIQSSNGAVRAQQWGSSGDVPQPGDYDGDHRTDIAVYRPSTGVWFIINSSTGAVRAQQWGAAGDVPVPGDYDGDGRTDIAVYRPSTGVWFILNSSTGGETAHQWGATGDIPVPGDYDGDGKTDIAVYRPSTGVWYIINSSTGAVRAQQWGAAGDVPVPGDYDGDGKTDIAVYRPSTGVWLIIRSSTGAVQQQQWGAGGDQPLPEF